MYNSRKFRNLSDVGVEFNNVLREITSADGFETDYLRRL